MKIRKINTFLSLLAIFIIGFWGCTDNSNPKMIGKIAPRHAHEISSSNWSVGAETMDRDFTVYDNWKQYLGPLGFKKARVFSGWAKTEIAPNQYDFKWLDTIISDMIVQGVTPWITLAYGNPLHTTFVDDSRGDPPRNEKAYQAWEAYVKAFVERYKDHIHEYEIWNEPRPGKKISPEEYAVLVIRTAEVIRSVQPDAKIYILAMDHSMFEAATDMNEDYPALKDYVRSTLEALKQQDALELCDAVTYHPYAYNPDESYSGVIRLREIVKEYNPRWEIIQGENGVPSTINKKRALSDHAWTELSQAKWALRRMLGDLCHDVPSSYFSMIDMCYPDEINEKGLLKARADKTVEYPKLAYYAMQNLSSVFDDRIRRIPDVTPSIAAERSISGNLFAGSDDKMIMTFWINDSIPSDSTVFVLADITVSCRFTEPVYVDMLTGEIFKIKTKQIKATDGQTKFIGISIPDYPILIAEKSLLKIQTN